jgi:hypothetical protein
MVVPIRLNAVLPLGTHVPCHPYHTSLAVAFVILANFNKLNAIGLGFRTTLHFPAENYVSFAYIDSAMFHHITNPLSVRYPESV